MASYTPSPACCTTPAIIGPPYKPLGHFTSLLNTTTYVSGPNNSAKALFIIYDVFGFSSQILEGADKLAQQYKVFMPAFFGENPAPLEWAPIDGEMDESKLDPFCEGPGETSRALRRIEEFMGELRSREPGVESWGLVGYCWGGYVGFNLSLVSAKGVVVS
jgi:dienelactone hydrolase